MEYEVIYSKRRTVSLSVKDEKVIVRAPFGTTEKVIEEIVKKHERWVVSHLVKQKERNEREAALTDEDVLELKRLAKTILPAKVAYYANIMGLKYGRITITSAKKRFGSCSSSGNISFSYRLMLYPDAAVDYVVVHELSHLVKMNHSKRFYAIIERVLPNYKDRIKLLKK